VLDTSDNGKGNVDGNEKAKFIAGVHNVSAKEWTLVLHDDFGGKPNSETAFTLGQFQVYLTQGTLVTLVT